MINTNFPSTQDVDKPSSIACSDAIVDEGVAGSDNADQEPISERDLTELSVSANLAKEPGVLVPSTVVHVATKKTSLYRRFKAKTAQFLLTILALVPDDVIYATIFVLAALKLVWRHKFLSFILVVAGAVAFAHFHFKKIQTKNRMIHEKSILHINWKKVTRNDEIEPSNPILMQIVRQVLPFLPEPEVGVISASQVIDAIYIAAKNPRITGLACDFTMPEDQGLELPWIQQSNSLHMDVVQEFRSAVATFVRSKPANAEVIAYANTMCQNCYYAASAFKKIYIQPFGGISLHGRSSQHFYYKKLLDNLNITSISQKSSDAKDLYDQYSAYEMNAESKHASWELLNDLDRQYWDGVLTSLKGSLMRKQILTFSDVETCKLPPPSLFQFKPLSNTDCTPGSWKLEYMNGIKAAAKHGSIYDEDAIKYGLIDELRYPRDIKSKLDSYGKQLAVHDLSQVIVRERENSKARKSAVAKVSTKQLKHEQGPKLEKKIVDKTQNTSTSSPLVQPANSKPIVATVNSNNTLTKALQPEPPILIEKININGELANDPTLYSWINKIETAANDDDIEGILLRINCPGGSFLASDTLAEAILYAKSKKPVVASIGSMATSGGYYIAVVADRIVANFASLTGSIGVTQNRFDFSKFLETVGIKFISMSTTGVSTSMFERPSADQLEAEAARLQYLYKQFVHHVSQHRNISEWQLTHFLAKGNLFTGEQAFYRRLVDELGGMQEATLAACKLAGDRKKLGKMPFNCILHERKTTSSISSTLASAFSG
ncbi:hypothetical protein VKS41_002217 [Umbelopsis sp. WA50703]